MQKLRFIRETAATMQAAILGNSNLRNHVVSKADSDPKLAIKLTAAVAIAHANSLADALEETYGAGVWDA